MPADIANAVIEAYDELGEIPVAVRSSATAEDLSEASFAGQHDTYLNVQNKEALLKAIKECWASLWTARAILYRLNQGISPEVSLAVVVQEQISAEVSGVAFSINPGNNSYDEAVINSNFGLGESIVSGQVTPDTFVVDKVSLRILQKQLGTKETAFICKTEGGIEKQTPADPNAPSLTGEQVIVITKLVTKVESHYGKPMEIEWAYANGQLYLLQARAITVYVPLPEIMITKPGDEKYLYLDLIVATQGFQESLSVMGNEICGYMLETIKGDLGLFESGMEGGVLNVDGRQYLHFSNTMKGLGMRMATSIYESYDTPTRKILESIDLKAYMPSKLPKAMRGLKWRFMKYMTRVVINSLRGLLNPEKIRRQYDAMFERDVAWSKQLAYQDIPLRELVDRLVDRFGKQIDASMAVIVPALLVRSRLAKMFKNDDVKELLGALETGLKTNPTAEMGRQMFELA